MSRRSVRKRRHLECPDEAHARLLAWGATEEALAAVREAWDAELYQLSELDRLDEKMAGH